CARAEFGNGIDFW
nr:immunoglobulin heavy chain junction region [Macaca mulatta]MOY21995.1 immunoglobulin heavy chain junction region [Macaca mulatta]MOY22927.1 immunoglobulin heavy chain junction region [Macaca mulatta]MOY23283.1 immunoglobulin heavy chain junction region [Macaca mulatta]MOY23395.1 immunoglobulin heavy chain junction region [Macaca mulatta]